MDFLKYLHGGYEGDEENQFVEDVISAVDTAREIRDTQNAISESMVGNGNEFYMEGSRCDIQVRFRDPETADER